MCYQGCPYEKSDGSCSIWNRRFPEDAYCQPNRFEFVCHACGKTFDLVPLYDEEVCPFCGSASINPY